MPNSSPTARVVEVSPETAEKWLTDNTHNRSLNEKNVATLAAAMLRGEWKLNGSAICRDATGVLLDGQHRLAAVVRSGCTIKSLVVDGVEPDAQITIDTGRKRTFADTLKLSRGETDTNVMAAVCNRVYRWQTAQLRSLNRPATNGQLLSIYDEHHVSLKESTRAAHSVRRQLPVSQSTLALAHWLFSRIDADDTTFFFDRLKDGQGLLDGDPILALRQTVLNDLASPRGRGRISDLLLLALLIKSWNAYRRSETIKSLRWRTSGPTAESFPEPV